MAAGLALVVFGLVGCLPDRNTRSDSFVSTGFAMQPGRVSLGFLAVPPKPNPVPPRYEVQVFSDKDVREFLHRTLERDLAWGNEDRALRVRREEEDRPWGKNMAAPAGVLVPQPIEPVLNRLYGPTP